MRSRSRRCAVAGAVVAAIACAAACGQSAPSGPPPVRIGALVPVSGLGLTYYVAAFHAAERDINAHGGIHGRPVQVEVCDDRNDPNVAQSCARQLVADHVIATAANISEFSMVEAPILDAAGIPEIASEAINPEDSTLPTEFPIDGGTIDLLAGGLVGMRLRNLRSLFVVTVDVPSGRVQLQYGAQVVRAAGVDLLGAAYIPSAATDLMPYIEAAIDSHAQVVYPALPPALTIPFLLACSQAGATFKIMLPYGELEPRNIAAMGGEKAITEDDIEITALPPLSATSQFPALATFASDMDAELRAGDEAASPDQRNGGSLTSWLSVMIIARLASTLPVADSAHLLQALRTTPTVDTLGLTPPWTPSRPGPPAFPRMSNLAEYLVSQQHGVPVLVAPTPINPLQQLRLGA